MSKRIVVVGASDLFDLVLAVYGPLGGEIIGYSALEPSESSNHGRYKWLGEDIGLIRSTFPEASFLLGLSNNSQRRTLFEEVTRTDGELLSAIHPKAEIFHSAQLGVGVIVQPFSVVSSCARVEDGAYINYSALVGHDVTVGAFSFIGPGVKLLGDACIAEDVFIGAGAIIFPQVKVGRGARIAAGAIVRQEVPAGVSVVPQSQIRVITGNQ